MKKKGNQENPEKRSFAHSMSVSDDFKTRVEKALGVELVAAEDEQSHASCLTDEELDLAMNGIGAPSFIAFGLHFQQCTACAEKFSHKVNIATGAE